MKTYKLLIFYGCFLLLIGVVGFLSNPEKAKTALISGGIFGGLSILFGLLDARGFRPVRKAALGMVSFLIIVFGWRATVSWMSVFNGQSEKLVAASLITLMLIASAVLFPALLKSGRKDRVQMVES